MGEKRYVKKQKEEITSDLEEFEEDENEEKTKLNSVETKLLLSKKLIANIRETLNQLELVLASDAESVDIEQLLTKIQTADSELSGFQSLDKIVEGVFDGQNMVEFGRTTIHCPSKLRFKIKTRRRRHFKTHNQSNGSFFFKQIGPIEREELSALYYVTKIRKSGKLWPKEKSTAFFQHQFHISRARQETTP